MKIKFHSFCVDTAIEMQDNVEEKTE